MFTSDCSRRDSNGVVCDGRGLLAMAIKAPELQHTSTPSPIYSHFQAVHIQPPGTR